MSDTQLNDILRSLQTTLSDVEFVFVTVPFERTENVTKWSPLATIVEPEGLSLVIEKQFADRDHFSYKGVFKLITLQIVTNLHLVGLTAVVATALAQHNIPANVIAGHYHDHILVPAVQADQAVAILTQLSNR